MSTCLARVPPWLISIIGLFDIYGLFTFSFFLKTNLYGFKEFLLSYALFTVIHIKKKAFACITNRESDKVHEHGMHMILVRGRDKQYRSLHEMITWKIQKIPSIRTITLTVIKRQSEEKDTKNHSKQVII